MASKAYIFDCDGTILNTLPDIVSLTNRALHTMGFPTHSETEIESFVGYGARHLIEQAVPKGTSAEQVTETLDLWQDLYPEFGLTYTEPYEGMTEVLTVLHEAGMKLGVLSNKLDSATRLVVERYYPNLFDAIHGERPGVLRKPDPQGLLLTIEELGACPETTVYVGDSVIDALVAKKAGCTGVCVDWGYNSRERLQAAKPDYLFSDPPRLLDLMRTDA